MKSLTNICEKNLRSFDLKDDILEPEETVSIKDKDVIVSNKKKSG